MRQCCAKILTHANSFNSHKQKCKVDTTTIPPLKIRRPGFLPKKREPAESQLEAPGRASRRPGPPLTTPRGLRLM